MRGTQQRLTKAFTFHNVSINSVNVNEFSLSILNLHSIMYLLIRDKALAKAIEILFTFHNVSINSATPTEAAPTPTRFTFHNVSINSNHGYVVY